MEKVMANKYQELSGDVGLLSKKMRSAKNKDEFRRFQVVWLRMKKGLSVEQIAEATCYSASWVRQLHSLYKQGGIKAISASKRGGRYHENMSTEEEVVFLDPFIKKGADGGILEVGEIHRAYEKKMDRKVSLSVIYLLLHRHGWRKIAPRPQHPKANLEVQETFKKTGKMS
jgi:transposase